MSTGIVVAAKPTAATQQGAPSNKRPTLIIYPTVSPESVVIPIVSCIFGFPLLALLVICCLRRRAKLARERDRRRAGNCEAESAGTMSLARFSPMHKLGVYLAGPGAPGTRAGGPAGRAVSLRSERSLSRGFPSLELLDTVFEERSSDQETSLGGGS